MEHVARGMGLSLFDAARHALDNGILSKRPAAQMTGLLEFLSELNRRARDCGVAELLEQLIDRLDYQAYLEKTFPGQGESRT